MAECPCALPPGVRDRILEPPESNGTGTVSVDDRGDTATIKIHGETSDGAAIDATVECHSVFDFGG